MKPYNELTTKEKLACISLYPQDALKDNNWVIRREAYRMLGYTQDALKDDNSEIRTEAAEIYFNVLNEDEDIIIKNGKRYKLID